jgi:hypothetical protein
MPYAAFLSFDAISPTFHAMLYAMLRIAIFFAFISPCLRRRLTCAPRSEAAQRCARQCAAGERAGGAQLFDFRRC